MAVLSFHSLIRVESLSSDCVTRRDFADTRFILFVPLCDCKSAAPIPKLEVSHIP